MKTKITIVVFAIIALLIIVPITRNILHEQLSIPTATIASNDYLVQLARTQEIKPNEIIEQAKDRYPEIDHLRKLIDQYPNRPEGYACLMLTEMRNYNIEPERAMPPKNSKSEIYYPIIHYQEKTKQFLDDADAGMQADPSNGFFLADKALALLTEHKDNEALACIASIPQCPKWDDYWTALYLGRVKSCELNNGWSNSLDNTEIETSIIFPQYAYYRQTTRHLIKMAIDSEQAGDIEKGYQIRQIVYRFGKNMADRPQTVIEALVGAAIENDSYLSTIKYDNQGEFSNSLWQKTSYVDYLRSTGKTPHANVIDKEQVNTERTRSEIRRLLHAADQQNQVFFGHASITTALVEYLIGKDLCIGVIFSSLFGLIFLAIGEIVDKRTEGIFGNRILRGAIAAFVPVGTTIAFASILAPFLNNNGNGNGNSSALGFLFQNNSTDELINILPVTILFLLIVLVIQMITATISAIIAIRREKSSASAFSGSFKTSSLAAALLFVFAYLAILPSFLINNEQANRYLIHDRINEVQYMAKLAPTVWPPKP